MKISPEILEKEVQELTAKFRNDKLWSDVKALAKSKGLDPMKTLLVGFHETEDELEYGVFLTEVGELIEYCRSTAIKSTALKSWKKRRGIKKLSYYYPAVEVGICLQKRDRAATD
jgi:adenosylcobinamide amidohydrolase